MLSRVADSLYWMSRYLERAEHAARMLDVQLNLMLDERAGSSDRRWGRAAASLGLKLPSPDTDVYTYVQAQGFELITACVISARENARQVREQISSEMWEQLNRLFHRVRPVNASESWDGQPLEFLSEVRERSHLFQGITDSTMNHGEGWHFIQVGRYMERAAATANLLDVHFQEFGCTPDQADEPEADTEWAGLLRGCTAFEAYCKFYTADLRPGRITEFLLLNSEFPHSVRFAADQMLCALDAIHVSTSSKKSGKVAKLAGRLSAGLSFTPLEEITGDVHRFLDTVRKQCAQIHAALYQVYVMYPIEAALEA